MYLTLLEVANDDDVLESGDLRIILIVVIIVVLIALAYYLFERARRP